MKNAAKMILNKLPKLKTAFAQLAQQEVLVGVPSEDAARKSEEKQPMNNATLAYIQDNGSPAANIPERPFMRPGIQDCKEKVVKQFKNGAKAALEGNADAIDKALHTSGLIAQAAIRNRINAGPPPPLAKSTLAARRRRGRTGTVPLVDTGQLRNSINYVLRKKT